VNAGLELSLRIGQRVRHQDYMGKRVTGVVQGVSIDPERGLMVDCALDTPIVIPPGHGYQEIKIYRQCAPAHEFSPFDDRDELIAEMLKSLSDLLTQTKRCFALVESEERAKVAAMDAARAVIAKATREAA
jgi:hypothetical protein